jgi:hypothetical protein
MVKDMVERLRQKCSGDLSDALTAFPERDGSAVYVRRRSSKGAAKKPLTLGPTPSGGNLPLTEHSDCHAP